MTLDEIESRISALEIEREEIETTLADIRGQLGKSSADYHAGKGGRDADWYHRASGALRYTGADHQSVLREIKALKKQAKEMRHAEFMEAQKKNRPACWYFFRLAEQELDAGVFGSLFDRALVMKQQAEA